jgi:hypothetical protein
VECHLIGVNQLARICVKIRQYHNFFFLPVEVATEATPLHFVVSCQLLQNLQSTFTAMQVPPPTCQTVMFVKFLTDTPHTDYVPKTVEMSHVLCPYRQSAGTFSLRPSVVNKTEIVRMT